MYIMDSISTYVNKISKNHELLAAISIVTIMTRVFIESFRVDIYEPITDYIFPNMFKDIVIKNPGKRPIRLGSFIRKVLIWLISIFLIILLF